MFFVLAGFVLGYAYIGPNGALTPHSPISEVAKNLLRHPFL